MKKTQKTGGKRRGAVRRNPPSASNSALAPNQAPGPFHVGAVVLATLNNPREKFWGAVLALDPAGLSLRCVELSSFEDATNMVIAGEPMSAATLFFPMHRVERIELDLPEGAIPSLSQRFTNRTGFDPADVLVRGAANVDSGGAGA